MAPMRFRLLSLLGVTPLIVAASLSLAAATVGSKAPSFSLKSADDKTLTSDFIHGKVTVLFYESKDALEKNRTAKATLNRYYVEQNEATKKRIARIAVLDCSVVPGPPPALWKRKLQENSLRDGLTSFCDWDGKMKAAYQMKEADSNVVVIDRKGVVRYLFRGRLENSDIEKLRALLLKLGAK